MVDNSNYFKLNSVSFSKNELALLSNISRYLEQLNDAQKQLLEKQASFIQYTSDSVIDDSNHADENNKTKICIDTNLSILSKLIQYAMTIDSDIHELMSLFKTGKELDLKNKYQSFKPVVKKFIHYTNDTKKLYIKNNSIIHKFLKKAKKQHETNISIQQLNNAKHQKIYQSKLLLITENKIFLPYRNEEIQKILEKSSTKQIENIINKKYVITNTKPYKSSNQNRFALGYKLSKNISKNSTLKAIKFAIKVSRIKNLHPAIIQACSSQDQLENYIMFLNQGNPSLFTDFEVKFQINPI